MILGRHTPPARLLLRKLLRGKIEMTPLDDKQRGYRLRARSPSIALSKAKRANSSQLGGPNGICHLVGQSLRFPLKGTAFRN